MGLMHHFVRSADPSEPVQDGVGGCGWRVVVQDQMHLLHREALCQLVQEDQHFLVPMPQACTLARAVADFGRARREAKDRIRVYDGYPVRMSAG